MVGGADDVVGAAVVAAQRAGTESVKSHVTPCALPGHCHLDKVMSGLPVSAPADVVLGAVVVVGAGVVAGAAVVAA